MGIGPVSVFQGVPMLAAEVPSDAELAKILHLQPGAEIIRKNGKRMLLTPLSDETVAKLVKFQAARAKMSEALEGVPKPIPAHKASQELYYKVRASMDNNNFDKAIAGYSKYIADFTKESQGIKNENQDEHDYYLCWGYQSRAICYLNAHNYSDGIADLNEAIKLRPRYRANYVNRAKALRIVGNIKMAEKDEEKIRSFPARKGDAEDLAAEFPVKKQSGKTEKTSAGH